MAKSKHPLPANEDERLETLKRYKVLDTMPEKEFDDITKLAAAICGVPMTLITLIDSDRQWFKSKIGFEDSETGRSVSFCQYAILQDQILEVEDATRDERFAENPFVTGHPDIRFYAGAPLQAPNGHNLGTLCVLDNRPKKLTEQQREALTILAQQVIANLELRKQRNEAEQETKLVTESNDLLNAFFENSPSTITMRDVNGRYLYANSNVQKAWGRKISEIVGKSVYELTTKELADEINADDREVIQTKKALRKEYKNGEGENTRYYASTLFPLLNEKKEVYGVGTITSEVTATKKIEVELHKTNERLEASNERFTSLFYNSPTGIAIADIVTGKLIMVNNSFLTIFRYEHAAEVVGRSAAQLGMISDQATRESNMEEVRKYGRVKEKEILAYRKDGDPVYCLTSIEFIEMGGKKVAVSAFQDITEYKLLEKEIKESNERFTSLFYNSPIGISISNVETSKLIMINNSYLNMFGFEEKEVIGKSAYELGLITDQRERDANIEEVRRTGRIKDKEIVARKKNGEIIYCLTSIEFIELEGKMCAISAFQDITERKKIELQLNEAKKEAEQATLSKSFFLANMSHEIRTPLNAMLGFADLLEGTKLNEQQKDYLDAIDTSGKNLLTIINDILDFSKIEAGMLSIEQLPFSPQQLMHSVYTLFFTKAQNKNLKLYISVDPKLPALLSGDPTRLNQVMINLLSNAIKFTAKGSVSVDCEVIKRTEEKVQLKISVKDTGIGIPAEKMATIFDRFTQAESDTTRNYGGTGLGLSIVKKLIELQGGEIHVNSVQDKGSEFYFTIWYAIADEKEYVMQQQERQQVKVTFKGKRVLIVEDNPLNQKLALTLLQNEGFEAEIAENGQVAVDLLKEKKYDVILMDLQMPMLDGYQATRKIRRELNNRTPIIAMTANAMAGEQERCIDMGMDDYITKPFKSESLLGILSRFLNSNGTEAVKEIVAAKTASAKITDLSYLQEFAGGKDTFVKEMLEVFLDQNPKDIEALETAMATNNFEGMKSIAHSLQTSLGFIGFNSKLISRLKEAEALASKKKDIDIVKANLRLIIDSCRQAQEELKKDLAQFN